MIIYFFISSSFNKNLITGVPDDPVETFDHVHHFRLCFLLDVVAFIRLG